MEQITVIKRDGTKINLVCTEPFRGVTSFSQEYGLMSDDYVKISIKSDDIMRFNIGDKIIVGSDEYSIRTNNTTEIINDNSYTYQLTFYGVMYDLMKTIYKNCDSNGNYNKLSFDLTYSLKDFVKVMINCLNIDYPNIWLFDEDNCPDTSEKTITFDYQNCLQVLQTLCSEDNFDYDFLITQSDGIRTIHIGTFGSIITPPNNAQYFEVGKGKGLYKLKEDKVDDKSIITRLFVEGGTTNIRSAYRSYSDRLQLPYPKRTNKHAHTLSDGTVIAAGSEQIGIDDDSKRYFEDSDLNNKIGIIEDAIQNDDIYPSRTGTVSALGDDVYTFLDDSMDFNLNETWEDTDADYAEYIEKINADETRSDYSDDIVGNTKYLISDTSAKITFTSGYLAGEQFDLKSYDNATKTFVIKKYTDDNGLSFPSETSDAFQIRVGDTYKITDINLPTAYEEDAEEDLWYYGYDKFLYKKQARVQYTLTFTEDFFLNYLSDDTVTDLFHVGDYIPIKDERFDIEKNIRITKVTRNLMKKYDYTLTVSDTTTISVLSQIVDEVINHETIINKYGMKDLTKAKRGWRTTEELRNMIFDTDGYFDTDNIKPNSIDTNMLTVGSKSQQFVLIGIVLQANVNGLPNRFDASDGVLAHLTIDDDIRLWNLTGTSVTLSESGGYYVYAKCSKSGTTGTYYITQEQLKFEPASDSANYYFLIGIIGSLNTDDNFRDFTTTYGFTRINGRTITTGRIVSSDGNCYLDLDNNLFSIGDSDSSLTWANKKLIVKGILVQDQGGTIAELGLYRGTYNSNTLYYKGDEVSYDDGIETCTYRYTNTTASKGNLPTNSVYWSVVAKGSKGDTGTNGVDGIADSITEFYEYRYAKNGSTTTPPTLDNSASDPSGWSKEMPTVGTLEYLWCTIAKKSSLVDHTLAHLPITASDTDSVADSIGGYNADYSDGAALYNDSERGYVMALNGTGESQIPLDLPWGKSFTLCFWLKTDQSSISWMLNCYMGREYLEKSIEVTANTWTHLAFRFNEKTITVFKDGTQIYTGSTTNVHVGFSLYDDNMFGTNAWYDEIRIFDTAISTESITKVMAGTTDNLISNWTTPVRVNGSDGAKGDKGDQGDSPVLVFRGVYDSSKSYYGNTTRLDAVKYNGVYYIARIDAGTFSNVLPTDTSKWNTFGAELETIATNLLLAEGANIGDWFMSGGKIVSTLGDGNKITLDASVGEILIVSSTSGGDYSLDSSFGSKISLNVNTGCIEIEAKTPPSYSTGTASMSPSGIFANLAGTNGMPSSSGYTHRGAIVGLGFADVDKSEWSLNANETIVAGVYGRASNNGTAPAYGGFFYNLFAGGLTLKKKAITTSSSSTYLTSTDALIIGYTSNSNQIVYLPTSPKEGDIVLFKQWRTGSMRVYPRSGQVLYDDDSENDYYDVPCGYCLIAMFTIGYVTSGSTTTKKEAWLVSRFKY